MSVKAGMDTYAYTTVFTISPQSHEVFKSKHYHTREGEEDMDRAIIRLQSTFDDIEGRHTLECSFSSTHICI